MAGPSAACKIIRACFLTAVLSASHVFSTSDSPNSSSVEGLASAAPRSATVVAVGEGLSQAAETDTFDNGRTIIVLRIIILMGMVTALLYFKYGTTERAKKLGKVSSIWLAVFAILSLLTDDVLTVLLLGGITLVLVNVCLPDEAEWQFYARTMYREHCLNAQSSVKHPVVASAETPSGAP